MRPNGVYGKKLIAKSKEKNKKSKKNEVEVVDEIEEDDHEIHGSITFVESRKEKLALLAQ
jgi:hypothetical protein